MAAIALSQLKHIPCLAHTLNLVVQCFLKSYPGLPDLLLKVRRLCSHIRRSPVHSSRMQNHQRSLKLPQHRLTIDVATRWNSTLHMLQRLCEQRRAVMYLWEDTHTRAGSWMADMELSGVQWSKVQDLCQVLQCFEECTRLVSADDAIISMSIPLMRLLMQSLTHVKEQASAAEDEGSLDDSQPLSGQGSLLDEVADEEDDGDEYFLDEEASRGNRNWWRCKLYQVFDNSSGLAHSLICELKEKLQQEKHLIFEQLEQQERKKTEELQNLRITLIAEQQTNFNTVLTRERLKKENIINELSEKLKSITQQQERDKDLIETLSEDRARLLEEKKKLDEDVCKLRSFMSSTHTVPVSEPSGAFVPELSCEDEDRMEPTFEITLTDTEYASQAEQISASDDDSFLQATMVVEQSQPSLLNHQRQGQVLPSPLHSGIPTMHFPHKSPPFVATPGIKVGVTIFTPFEFFNVLLPQKSYS
ncbi:unnamed protein product [Ranitomeya imitator]|uniref:Uncharacterized protein n=1 Tax=Ranitomeya imitator TaxID=111125 RepID=A0ABN9KSK4_9NEOB|nr:unnamed protein product [Ranitomeya imitator]